MTLGLALGLAFSCHDEAILLAPLAAALPLLVRVADLRRYAAALALAFSNPTIRVIDVRAPVPLSVRAE